ncbi:hypothetical protein WG904_18625 [Pedobacter sp. Du54]|uniref:hypothetical protein n=1 Tax=Pedobacter anseongensis TaxID=3133439 RepID=UPI003098F8B3
MNSNIYWPVYKNIESEFNNLMFAIHIDDFQLNVYSSKITDLILRSSTEIESLSKELYKLYEGTKINNIRYDEDALHYLNSLWNLEDKIVLISSYNCFVTKKEVRPFLKTEKRTGSQRLTYTWNNAYQNLKHDRGNSINFGNIKYLIDVTCALFLLNVYYKDVVYDLNDNSSGSNFDDSLGSTIYSIKLHVNSGVSGSELYNKNSDFSECTYLLKATDETHFEFQQVISKIRNETAERTRNESFKVIEQNLDLYKDLVSLTPEIKEIVEKANTKSIISVAQKNGKLLSEKFKSLKYHSVLNKNQY